MTFKEFREMIKSEISSNEEYNNIPIRYEDITGGVHILDLKLCIPRTKKGYLGVGNAYGTKLDLTGKDVLDLLSEFERAVSSLNPDRNNIEEWIIAKMAYNSTVKIKLVTDKNNEKYFVIY